MSAQITRPQALKALSRFNKTLINKERRSFALYYHPTQLGFSTDIMVTSKPLAVTVLWDLGRSRYGEQGDCD